MNLKFAAASALVLFSLALRPVSAQIMSAGSNDDVSLGQFANIPSVSGYEHQASQRISGILSQFHPVTDNLGDVIVTIGSGSPHRILAAPFDEPGYVVGEIRPDGYIRLRRVPASVLPGVFNELYTAQPVKIATKEGRWINGVVAGLSIHLEPGRVAAPDPRDIDNMYVDLGATSAAQVRRAGVDVLSPVVINQPTVGLNGSEIAGPGVGDKFGAAALMALLEGMDRSKSSGTLTIAFVTESWSQGRGLHRILATTPCDELLYVGRMLPSSMISAGTDPHLEPHRRLGAGVLFGVDQTVEGVSGFGAVLRDQADENKIPVGVDYSANPIDPGYDPPIAYPRDWAHIGIATAWPNTPVEAINLSDFHALVDVLGIHYGVGRISGRPTPLAGTGVRAGNLPGDSTIDSLKSLVQDYGVSNHETRVANGVKKALPQWARPESDDAGNLIVPVGSAPAGLKTPRILVVGHLDEIGYEVKSIDGDGILEAVPVGGFYTSFFQAHVAIVHHANNDIAAIMLPPDGWDQPGFKWPTSAKTNLFPADVGAHNPAEVAKLGIEVGDSLTIRKEYRPLLGTRANGRSFDDRVGDAAMIAALRALGGPLKDRDVTFVFSTGEELGLVGARKLAERLAAQHRTPDYVFAVDTFVSSDSPLESSRFAGARIGDGFVIRALDGSNVVPPKDVDRLVSLARANQIPVQYGATGGGNDGLEFVPFGSIDVAIGWPLRYAHSPAEVIDTRDVDSLARIIAVIAKNW